MAVDLEIEGYGEFSRVGVGGFSTVYRARQVRFDRWVAVKVLHVHEMDERAQRRFRRECVAAGSLSDHPFVVTVLDSGFTADGRPFIVSEFFSGGSLADRLRVDGPLPVGDVLGVGVKMAGALAAVHGARVLHRDVKPQNVLLSEYGEPALADFGISAMVGPEETTATASLSPLHTPPEVLEGHASTVGSDVYSLGSTLYMVLAGRGAFQGVEGEGVLPFLQRVMTQPVPPIDRDDVPVSLEAVLVKAMAKQPADRYPDAESFGAALQAIETELALPVTPFIGSRPRSPGVPGPGVLPSVAALPTTVPIGVPVAHGAPPDDSSSEDPPDESGQHGDVAGATPAAQFDDELLDSSTVAAIGPVVLYDAAAPVVDPSVEPEDLAAVTTVVTGPTTPLAEPEAAAQRRRRMTLVGVLATILTVAVLGTAFAATRDSESARPVDAGPETTVQTMLGGKTPGSASGEAAGTTVVDNPTTSDLDTTETSSTDVVSPVTDPVTGQTPPGQTSSPTSSSPAGSPSVIDPVVTTTAMPAVTAPSTTKPTIPIPTTSRPPITATVDLSGVVGQASGLATNWAFQCIPDTGKLTTSCYITPLLSPYSWQYAATAGYESGNRFSFVCRVDDGLPVMTSSGVNYRWLAFKWAGDSEGLAYFAAAGIRYGGLPAGSVQDFDLSSCP